MDILKYGDYEGTAEVDMARQVCRGKILFIDDLVTYEAASPANLQREFEAAVDDYVETCMSLGREPQKPFKGLFNVRVSPTLHRAVALRAMADSVSQNDVAVRALDAFVNAVVAVNHNVQVTFNVPEESMKTLVSSASAGPQWETASATRNGRLLMATTDSAVVPERPVPVESPLSMRELATVLVKHYGLHVGRYDLLFEYQIGVGPVGPDPASLVPGVMLGVGRVGLVEAKGGGPTSVDAAVVNPATVTRKKAAEKTSKVARARRTT